MQPPERYSPQNHLVSSSRFAARNRFGQTIVRCIVWVGRPRKTLRFHGFSACDRFNQLRRFIIVILPNNRGKNYRASKNCCVMAMGPKA